MDFMNKILQLFRHGKSSWIYDLPDHERPLKNRGLNDIKIMSEHLKKDYLKPNLIWSSTAYRARSTSENYIKYLDLYDVNYQLKKELYDFSGEGVLNQIHHCENTINILAIFGHNYALTNIVNRLGNTHINNLATSGFVQIEFEQIEWEKIKNGITTRIVYPRHLK